MTIRLDGTSDRLGQTFLSQEFSTWEINEPDVEHSDQDRMLGAFSIGVVLDQRMYFMVPNTGVHATFIELQDFELGREESRHMVKFGQLILNGPGIHEQPDFVAMKPFEDRQSLYREWAAGAYANGLYDEQRAFAALGVAKDEEGVTSMITLYEHGVKTADTVFWADVELQPEALRMDVIQTKAATCMYGLGLMHGARLIHGDAAVKNLGSDARHVRFIDLEDSTLIPVDGLDAEEYGRKIIRDISMFISSTMQVDQNRERVSDALSKPEVVDMLMENYERGITKAQRRQPNLTIPDYKAIHEDEIRDLIARQYS